MDASSSEHPFSLSGNGYLTFLSVYCAGCAVYIVADAAVSVGATVVKTTVKATGAVIDAVIPDSKSDKK